MLAEFSSLQHCRQSRNAETDVRSDFQEKLFRNNFWPLAKREALSFEKSGSNPCWRNFPLFSIAGRAGMLKLMSDLIFKKSCSGTTFFRLDFLNYEKKTTIKQSIGSKKRPRRKRPLLFKSQLFCI